jgi:HAD superfamily hydrolase (TIGR01509 family)
MAVRAIVFDFDGLILDTETPMQAAWREIFEQHGLIIPDAEWASLLGSSADPPEAYDLLEKHLGMPVDRGSLHRECLARELELLASEEVLPGVRELVREAQAAAMRLAVASSSERQWVEELLEQHGLLEVFDAIVCAEDVQYTKPAADLFLTALDRLSVQPHEAIAFEDSEHGVRAAKAAGVFCIAVPNRVTRCLSFHDADRIVSSIADHPLSDYVRMATSSPWTSNPNPSGRPKT